MGEPHAREGHAHRRATRPQWTQATSGLAGPHGESLQASATALVSCHLKH